MKISTWFLVLIFPACTPPYRSPQKLEQMEARIQTRHSPTKDDVAVVAGQRFSVTNYLKIQRLLSKGHRDKEQIFWIGAAAIVLSKKYGAPRKVPHFHSVQVARFAAGELSSDKAAESLTKLFGEKRGADAVRREALKLLKLANIKKNPQVLAELR